MLKYVYSVFDKKCGEFDSPIISDNIDCCKRLFDSMLNYGNSSDSILSRYPLDFCVYCLGAFDTCSGSLSAVINDGDCPSVFPFVAFEMTEVVNSPYHSISSADDDE